MGVISTIEGGIANFFGFGKDNSGTHGGGGGSGDSEGPEEVAQDALDDMYAEVGNAGQEAIIDEISDDWIDMAVGKLTGSPIEYDEYVALWEDELGDEKYHAVDLILDVGFEAIGGRTGKRHSKTVQKVVNGTAQAIEVLGAGL